MGEQHSTTSHCLLLRLTPLRGSQHCYLFFLQTNKTMSSIISYRFAQKPDEVHSIAVDSPSTLLNTKLAIVRSANLTRGLDFDFVVTSLNPASRGRTLISDGEVLVDGTTIEVRRVHRRHGLRARAAGVATPPRRATCGPLPSRPRAVLHQRPAALPVHRPPVLAPNPAAVASGRRDLRPAWQTAPGAAAAATAANVAAASSIAVKPPQPTTPSGSIDELALLEKALEAPEETAEQIAEREKRALNKPLRPRNNLDEPLAIPHDGYICDRCNKPGHYKRDCPTIGNAAYDGGGVRKELHAAPGMPVIFMRQVKEGVTDKETDARTIVNVSGGQATFITASRQNFLETLGVDSDEEPFYNPPPPSVADLRKPLSEAKAPMAAAAAAPAPTAAAPAPTAAAQGDRDAKRPRAADAAGGSARARNASRGSAARGVPPRPIMGAGAVPVRPMMGSFARPPSGGTMGVRMGMPVNGMMPMAMGMGGMGMMPMNGMMPMGMNGMLPMGMMMGGRGPPRGGYGGGYGGGPSGNGGRRNGGGNGGGRRSGSRSRSRSRSGR